MNTIKKLHTIFAGYKEHVGSVLSGIFVALFTFLPQSLQAAILVPIVPESCNTGTCGWEQLVQMGQNFLRDAVVFVGIAAVLSITYAGYLYATAGGNDGQIKKAHEVFGRVVWGIFFTLGAWLVVYSVTDWIGVNDEFKALK